jgi:hypothetical protein
MEKLRIYEHELVCAQQLPINMFLAATEKKPKRVLKFILLKVIIFGLFLAFMVI